MTAVIVAVGLVCLGMFAIHHWAARRMLVVEKESGPGLLDLAEEARPALVLSQILAAGLAVVLVGAWPQLGAVGRVVVTSLVLMGGLLVPLRFADPQRGGIPWWVRILSWPLSRHTEGDGPRNGGPMPGVDPLDELAACARHEHGCGYLPHRLPPTCRVTCLTASTSPWHSGRVRTPMRTSSGSPNEAQSRTQ